MPVTDYWLLVYLSAAEHDWLHAEATRWCTTCGRVAEWAIRRRRLRARASRERRAPRAAYYILVGLRRSDYAWLGLEARCYGSTRGLIVERALRAERRRTQALMGMDD